MQISPYSHNPSLSTGAYRSGSLYSSDDNNATDNNEKVVHSQSSSGWFDFALKRVLPFTNEVAVSLDHSVLPGLYDTKNAKFSWLGKWLKTPVDFIALSSILMETSREVKHEGFLPGFFNGIGLMIFSFILPSPVIKGVQKLLSRAFLKTDIPKNNWMKLLFNVVGIGVLEGCVSVWEKFVTPFFTKLLKPHEQKLMGSSHESSN